MLREETIEEQRGQENQKPEYKPNQILVNFEEGVSSAEIASIQQEIGAKEVDTTEITGVALWEIAKGKDLEAAIRNLESNEAIAYAQPNYQYSAQAFIPNDPDFNELWGLNNTGQTGGTEDADVDAPEAWDINTGSDEIIVGVIDIGVDYDNPDLAANMWTNPDEIAGDGIDNDGNGYVDDIYGYDFVYGDSDPSDVYGHGTHVSGTIGAVGNDDFGIAGVNWNVKIMALKFLDDYGYGYTFDAIKAIEYAIAEGANLTNNSWGGGGYDQALADAIAAAGEAGQLFVAAAGNDYQNNNDIWPAYPASYELDNIISVAATDHNDNLAYFSNYGPESVDIGAPGEDIYSTLPWGYEAWSGTSMATPHVAGAAALLWAEEPDLTWAEVKERLLSTVDIVDSLDGLVSSDGRLNLYNALKNITPPPGYIEGYKWFDKDGDGTWDTNETGLAGQKIFLDKDKDGVWDANEQWTVTAANGYYQFEVVHGTYYVTEVQDAGWQQTYPITKEIFNADFSKANGDPNKDGFTLDNYQNGLWHLSTGRGTQAGHSADDSLYYGKGEGANGGGNYDAGDTAGKIISPVIDLTNIINAQLSFNYFLETERPSWDYFDYATVSVSENGGAYIPIATSNTYDSWYYNVLVNPTTGWTNATFDLSEYEGSQIQVKFEFDTVDAWLNDYEGWYVDDVKVTGTEVAEVPIFEADFSKADGTPNLDSFVIDNYKNGLWHLSTGRGNQEGHTADDSTYYGTGEGPDGGGNYDRGDNGGRITSSWIDLTDFVGAKLSFNYFLQTEYYAPYYDVAKVLVKEDDKGFVEVASNAYEIADWTTGWTKATFDLSEFAGSNIKVRFEFDTLDDAVNAYEGWYVDDVKVSGLVEQGGLGGIPKAHEVDVDSGEVVTNINFGNYYAGTPMNGTTANDTLNGTAANDVMYGQAGGDKVYGKGGKDMLDGAAGNDWLQGDAGNDMLMGGAGADSLLGGSGNDFLIGNAGADKLTGGGGNDRFVFNAAADKVDQILDFAPGVDKISVSASGFGIPVDGNLADYFTYVGKDLFFEGTKIAVLTTQPALSIATDIEIFA